MSAVCVCVCVCVRVCVYGCAFVVDVLVNLLRFRTKSSFIPLFSFLLIIIILFNQWFSCHLS